MTDQDKLTKIRAKCEWLIADHEGVDGIAKLAVAGWRATIAAIDGLLQLAEKVTGDIPDDALSAYNTDSEMAEETLNQILSAWPDELLED